MYKAYILIVAIIFSTHLYGQTTSTLAVSKVAATETATHVDIVFSLTIAGPAINFYSCNFQIMYGDLTDPTQGSVTNPSTSYTTNITNAGGLVLNSIVDDIPNAVSVGSQVSWTVNFKKGSSSTINFTIGGVNECLSTDGDDFPATISGGNITLPVSLIKFTAHPQGKTNFLDWQTANEKDNDGFSIERSAEGKVFQTIGFVKGHGTTTEKQSYTFTDDSPLSISYYRLKMIDFDGSFEYSKVIVLSARLAKSLKVYPSPVADFLTVDSESKGEYEIYNLLGQQVLNGKTPPSSTGTPLEGVWGLDVSALPQGSYFLKVGVEQVKFVKY